MLTLLAGYTQLAGNLGLADAGGKQLAAQLAGLEPLTFLLGRSTARSGRHG